MSKRGSFGLRSSFSAFFLIQSMTVISSANVGAPLFSQERRLPQADLAVEVSLPDIVPGSCKIKVPDRGRDVIPIERGFLKILYLKLVADFSAVALWAEADGNAVRVRLSLVFSDLSDKEWWKDEKEQIVGSVLIREGESASLPDLMLFYIEPFEMRVISPRTVAVQPGKEPKIANHTNSVEVVKLETPQDTSLYAYRIVLKNNSKKNAVAYTISTGGDSVILDGVSHINLPPAIAAGGTSYGMYLPANEVKKNGITITVVIFDDGTFEGDTYLAALFLTGEKGVRIQAPSVLRMIEKTFQVKDAELEKAFNKLETELWVIPEAIHKQTAIDRLKSEYPTLEQEMISRLYEELKRGLHGARDSALMQIANIKFLLQEDHKNLFLQEYQRDGAAEPVARARLLREKLMRIKDDLERVIESKR